MASLEEFLQEKYVAKYDETQDDKNKIDNMLTWYPDYFYNPSKDGIGSLRYVVDSQGHSLYLIKKSGLPKEIKDQLVGGEAGSGTYQDYVSLKDVYGVTSDLKVYYCDNGIDSINGVSIGNLDNDNPTREVFAAGSAYAQLLTGDATKKVTLGDIKSKTNLTISDSSTITSLSEIYNFPNLKELTLENYTGSTAGIQNAIKLESLTIKDSSLSNLINVGDCSKLYYIYFKNSTCEDYSDLCKLGSKLNYLYFYSIDDNELNTICSGLQKGEFTNLQYFGVFGYESTLTLSDTSTEWLINNKGLSVKASKTITKLDSLSKLSSVTQKAINYLYLNSNNLTGDLSKLTGFKNVKFLRIENNHFTSLAGIKNMSLLEYLFCGDNNLGSDLDGETKNSSKDCLSELGKCENLYYLRASNNSKLRWVDYLVDNDSLEYLYLDGCSKVMNINVISSLIDNCKDYSLPVKYLNGTNYIVSTYYNPVAGASYSELYSDLYGNLHITQLDLSYVSISNEQLNTILSSMINLEDLNLHNTNLTTIDFALNCTKIKSLNLLNTNVTDLSNLNNISTIRGLVINNSDIDLVAIQTTINRLTNKVSTFYCSWCYGGLTVYENPTLFKKLESCTSLSNLYLSSCAGDGVVDLSSFKNLKNIWIRCESKLTPSEVIIPNDVAWLHLVLNGKVNFSKCSYIGSFNLEAVDVDIFRDMWGSVGDGLKIDTYYAVYTTDLNFGVDFSNKEVSIRKVISSDIGTPWYEQSVDLSYLGTIKGVKTFYSYNISFSSSYLSKLTDLTTLTIKNNSEFENLLALSKLTNLQSLTITNSGLSSVKGIENLKSLTTLDLRNNCLDDNSTYEDENGVTKSEKTVDLIAGLNPANGGKLKTLHLDGNNIINTASLRNNLSWSDDSSGF